MKNLNTLLIIFALAAVGCSKDNNTVPITDTVKFKKPPIKDREPIDTIGFLPWDGKL